MTTPETLTPFRALPVAGVSRWPDTKTRKLAKMLKPPLPYKSTAERIYEAATDDNFREVLAKAEAEADPQRSRYVEQDGNLYRLFTFSDDSELTLGLDGCIACEMPEPSKQ